MPACASILGNFLLPRNICDSKDLCGFSPSSTYTLHPRDPPEVDDVPLGIIIAYAPVVLLDLIINMKSKLMV